MDLLILHGDDTFSSRQRLRTLVAGFQKKYDPTGGNIVRFSPPFELGQMRNAIAQVGMFAKKRLVVLNDFLRTASVADSTQFNSWFADPTAFPDAVVICWEGKDLGKPASPHASRGGPAAPKKPAKPKKATAKKAPPKAPTKISWPEHAKVELFLPLAEAQLAGWIRKEVQRLGGLIEPNAVHLLMANVGADLWRLSNIIAQLVAAAGKAPVDVALVNQWTQAPHDDNMFHFTDALATRNLPAALKLMHGQILLGVHPLVLHVMLVRQIRILLMVADCVERGSAPGAIAEETDLHPFVAQKAVAAVRQFPKGRLAQLFQDVVQLEVDMKTGKVDPEIGLTHFLTKVCAG